MRRKLEEKILEEIRRRVLEKDSELKKKEEDKLVRDSNIEALIELTSLSKKEVENIAKSVRTEKEDIDKKQKKQYIYIGISVSVLILILTIMFWPEPKINEIVIEDNFSNNEYSWSVFNDFKYKRTIKDGYYFIETNVDGYCYWDDVEIDFPKNYDVLVTSIWKRGKFESYGFELNKDDGNYSTFLLKADGTAAYGKIMGRKWAYENNWKGQKSNTAETKKSNLQLVEVRGDNFKYYVNNNLVDKGKFGFKFNKICLRSCGEQLIAFDNLKLINSDNNEIVFEDDFEKPTDKWSPKEKTTKQSFFKDGEYILKVGDADGCHFTVSQKHQISNNCEIELTSTWIGGENADYGIIIMEENQKYISCEMKSDGNVRIVKFINGEYTSINDYTQTKYIGNGNLKHTQKIVIKDNKINYYIDNEFMQSIALSNIIPIKIGLRVCEQQTIAFDKIKIKIFE